jgi:hypothetical protein
MAATKKQTQDTPEPTEATVEQEQPKTIRDAEIGWGPHEGLEKDQDGAHAIVAGYELEVIPSDGDKPFAWIVRATSEVSETPEIIDASWAATVDGGKRWARQALNKTLRASR